MVKKYSVFGQKWSKKISFWSKMVKKSEYFLVRKLKAQQKSGSEFMLSFSFKLKLNLYGIQCCDKSWETTTILLATETPTFHREVNRILVNCQKYLVCVKYHPAQSVNIWLGSNKVALCFAFIDNGFPSRWEFIKYYFADFVPKGSIQPCSEKEGKCFLITSFDNAMFYLSQCKNK